jgi:hypothetical protein
MVRRRRTAYLYTFPKAGINLPHPVLLVRETKNSFSMLIRQGATLEEA